MTKDPIRSPSSALKQGSRRAGVAFALVDSRVGRCSDELAGVFDSIGGRNEGPVEPVVTCRTLSLPCPDPTFARSLSSSTRRRKRVGRSRSGRRVPDVAAGAHGDPRPRPTAPEVSETNNGGCLVTRWLGDPGSLRPSQHHRRRLRVGDSRRQQAKVLQ